MQNDDVVKIDFLVMTVMTKCGLEPFINNIYILLYTCVYP